jgi:ribosomal-protein-alanine N-acetyltransferase
MHDTVRLRPVDMGDAEPLAALVTRNRAYLAPWEPDPGDGYFTVEGQRENLKALIEAQAAGELWAAVILVAGEHAGRITLNNILRGPLQSCWVGYWVAERLAGRGVATEAVRQALDVAFGELRLHRVEAFTLIGNSGSQRVLERNRFEPVGVARSHIHLSGRWHDQYLYERISS